MTVLVVFLAIVLIGVVYGIYNTIEARRQVEVIVPGRPPQVAARVETYFGRTWTRVHGPGDINVRPALRYRPATLSIDITEEFGNRCRVEIWTSSWTNHLGLMGHGQLARRKKNGLASSLIGLAAVDPGHRPAAA